MNQLERIIRFNINSKLIHDDRIADLVEGLEQYIHEEIETALRYDRKANTAFWKSKVDSMFDREIAAYEELLSGRKKEV